MGLALKTSTVMAGFSNKAVPGALMTKTETYEVNRALRDVALTFRRRAPECLNLAVRTVSRTATSYQNILTQYKTTVVVTAERAELHVQQEHKTGRLGARLLGELVEAAGIDE